MQALPATGVKAQNGVAPPSWRLFWWRRRARLRADPSMQIFGEWVCSQSPDGAGIDAIVCFANAIIGPSAITAGIAWACVSSI